MAKKLIQEYVFSPGRGLMDNNRPNATHLINVNKAFIVNEMIAFIQNKVAANDADYLGITYNYTRLTNDFNNLVDEVIFDLQYTGNEGTRDFSQKYWDENVPVIPGNRIAEREAIEHFKILLPYVLGNTDASSVAEQAVATQVIDTDYTSESLSDTAASQLLTQVQSVLQNGLTSLPDLIIGLGRIEVLGKIQLEDILIITNVTDNIVIYNFADNAKGGTVEFKQGNTTNYPRASAVNEGTTVLNFYFNTTSMSTDDNIQIFFEESELKVRLADISMDAMERVKIGKPQAMLDADFEYGLQPTKWQAIATERGYPSVYEVPASDIAVTTVTTDASTPNNGVGASLITVTTTTPHDFTAGDPFTIRALSSSILGFNRAEGTFIVDSSSNSTTFTYYAKSKVGDTSGQVLATTNTQLRRGGFYTGSKISDATFTIPQQGGSGSFTTTLQAPNNTGFITFTGTAPSTGIVLSGTGIATGAQVNGVFGTTNVNGIEASKYVANDFTSGDSSITLSDVTGISQGMALTNAAATPEQLIITSINGSTLNLNGPITTNYTGDTQQYTNLVVSSANYLQGTGTGATFDINIDAGLNYSITGFTGGSNYNQGDTLLIPGTSLGGTSPTNDIIINVLGVNAGAIVQPEIISSSTGASTTSYTGVASSQTTNNFLTNATLVLARNGGTYQFVSTTGGNNFRLGNRFTISGTDLGGTSPTNDAIVTIDGVSGTTPSSFSATGNAVRGDQIDIYATISLSTNTVAQISAATSITTSGIARIAVEFADAHGLTPGSAITTIVTSDSGTNNHNLAAGPFFVQRVVDDQTIEYDARSDGTIDLAGGQDAIKGQVYVRPDAFFTHRPYDGGVKLGTGSPQHGNQAIRMSKKYIRYQSGKGAMYNTGALFAPNFDISSMTADGTAVGSIITIETDDQDHGLQ